MANETKEKKCRTKLWLAVAIVLAFYATILSTYIGLKIGVFDSQSPIRQQPLINFTITKKYAKKNLTYAKAQESKKPMVVLFYADWCKFCKMLAPNFDKTIKKRDFKKAYAAAYVNCDDPANQKLVEEFEIRAFPTVYLITPDGKKKMLDVSIFHEKEAVGILNTML